MLCNAIGSFDIRLFLLRFIYCQFLIVLRILRNFQVASLLTGGGKPTEKADGGSAPGKPYLSTLSQPELEKIGLKAVEAGANPLALQSAFVTAQKEDDWSKLENLIRYACEMVKTSILKSTAN